MNSKEKARRQTQEVSETDTKQVWSWLLSELHFVQLKSKLILVF